MSSYRILKVIQFLLYLLVFLGVSQSQKSDEEPCFDVDVNTNKSLPCNPCKKEEWIDLVMEEQADVYQPKKCFNTAPLGSHVSYFYPVTIASGKPDLDNTETPRGFIVPNEPFFRYAKAQMGPLDPKECVNVSNEAQNLDLAGVEKYYGGPDTPSKMEADFQLLEWPGRDYKEQKDVLERKVKAECQIKFTGKRQRKPKHCKYPTPRNFQMLKFERDSSKLLHYPCNKEEGTSISAFGFITIQDREEKKEEPHNKVYLAYNNITIFDEHVQPLMVSEWVLNEMAKPLVKGKPAVCVKESEEPENCEFHKKLPEANLNICQLRQKYFQDRQNILFDAPTEIDATESKCENGNPPNPNLKTNIWGDLRTVLDFTFVQGRLLLAMRCGITIVDGILFKHADIRTASLVTSHGKNKNTFNPINKISASICCNPGNCRKTIVAAYPSNANLAIDTTKEIYVSFDLGETFHVKLIANQISALNLIWGLYKMYSKWLVYFQLFEKPDPEDLKDNLDRELHPGLIKLRSRSDWNSLTVEERERMFKFGVLHRASYDLETWKNAFERHDRLLNQGTLRRILRYRRKNETIELDLAPDWVTAEIFADRKKNGAVNWTEHYTDSNCDNFPECRHHFVNDAAVEYFLKDANVTVKTPKRKLDEPFCHRILSLTMMEEEDSMFGVCLVGFGDHDYHDKRQLRPCSSKNSPTDDPNCRHKMSNGTDKTYTMSPCTNDVKYYAIYTFVIKEKLPIVVEKERRSERFFTCRPIKVPLDKEGCKYIYAQPEIIRVPNSITLIIKNCEGVLYYSQNGGRTLINAVFNAASNLVLWPDRLTNDKKLGKKSCDAGKAPFVKPVDPPPGTYQRIYKLEALKVPPQISVNPSKTVILITMKHHYAYGLMSVNEELRFVVGEIFPEGYPTNDTTILNKVKSNDYAFPGFSPSGHPYLAVALHYIYSHEKRMICKLYDDKNGMRLVKKDIFLYNGYMKPHFDSNVYHHHENRKLEESLRDKYGVGVCKTISFSVKPNRIQLDVGDNGIFEVKVTDARPNIPLGVLSSEEKSILVDVSQVETQRGDAHRLTHNWNIHVHAVLNIKPRLEALVDSFFGVENNNMYGYSTDISLANQLDFRCHQQPAGSVIVDIKCLDEKMVAHEDEHRPQCTEGTFSKHVFTYKLKKGNFDPDLVAFWMALDKKEGKQLIKLDKNGDLEIVYDYLRFGCPLEPYKDEHFIPDLRIVTKDKKFNSTLGEKYNGSFLLIELFGAKGYEYSQTFRDAECVYKPINLTALIEDWVHRQRLFQIAHSRQTVPFVEFATYNATKSVDEIRNLEAGNQLFIPDAVAHPINIVNRVTYRDCKTRHEKFKLGAWKSKKISEITDDQEKADVEKLLDQQLPIFKRIEDVDEGNHIKWGKTSDKIYIFMAVALDPYESLCEYYTIFGVSLPDVTEVNALVTCLVFVLFIILWILLFFCGYIWRKSRIRSLCIELERRQRLEEAAWKVVYRYEKLLQENENKELELEISEFKESHKDGSKRNKKDLKMKKNKKGGLADTAGRRKQKAGKGKQEVTDI